MVSPTHFIYLLQDCTEPCGQRVALLRQERVSGLCSFQAKLHVGEGHSRCEDIFAGIGTRHDGKVDKYLVD